jgi:Cthe_2314-like HEPN
MLNEKLYIISWFTLRDIIAALINKVFDLGIADADVKFDLVMRNKHIKNSDVSDIIKKYHKDLNIHEFTKHRNDIVHRGKTIDEELQSFYSGWRTLEGWNNLQGGKGHHLALAKETQRLYPMVLRKHARYEAHYKATLQLIDEILACLGRRTIETYKRSRNPQNS